MTPIAKQMKQTFASNIYVRGIPMHVNEEYVRREFVLAGKILSIKVGYHADGVSKYAFILYEYIHEAQKAIRMYNDSNLFGSKKISVDFWLSKQELEQEKKKKYGMELDELMNMINQM